MRVRNRDEILDSLIENFPIEDIPLYEGTFVYTLLSTLATAIEREYVIKDEEHKQIFIEDGYDEFLDKRVAEFGYTRKQGSNSSGVLTFIAPQGHIIPADLKVYCNGVEFELETTATVGADGECDINASSVDFGYNTNIKAGSDFTSEDKTIVRIFNKNNFVGGLDRENDEDLRTRFFYTQAHKPTSGNIYHYEKWAMDIDGVTKVKVKPLWNGNGTVKVIVSGKNGALEDDILNNVRDYINEKKPIGANVTIATMNKMPINININCTLIDKISKDVLKQKISDIATEYLENNQNKINFLKLYALIIGIKEIDSVSEFNINSNKSDIEIDDESYPVVGNIVVEVGDE